VAGLAGQLAPLPGASYGLGTMSSADLYPSHVGIGGIRSSEWTIPAFGDAIAQSKDRAVALGDAERQVTLATPAGWLALGILALILLAWLIE
jgi:hypothetical protein